MEPWSSKRALRWLARQPVTSFSRVAVSGCEAPLQFAYSGPLTGAAMNTVRASRTNVGRSRPARRGLITGVLLLFMVVLIAVIGLALELGLVYHAQIQLQNAADAAALAGAAQLLDDSVLRPGATLDMTEEVQAAQLAAISFAHSNIAASQEVTLAPNIENEAEGDICAGWLLSPGTYQSEFLPWNGVGPCNTLRVRAHRTSQRSNPVPLRIAPLVGIATADVIAEAQATVDQRVYGFRPIGNATAPVVPLAALHEGSEEAWLEQSQRPATEGDNDRFTVNYRTDAVVKGADGIPEIELRIATSQTSGVTTRGEGDDDTSQRNLGLLWLGGPVVGRATLDRQLLTGLTLDDLAAWGGELSLEANGTRLVPGRADADRGLVDTFRKMIGANRVWPLYSIFTEGDEESGYVLTGFAAGRIVSAAEEDGELIVLVQPSLLITSTALVRQLAPDEALNPWIAKLVLTH